MQKQENHKGGESSTISDNDLIFACAAFYNQGHAGYNMGVVGFVAFVSVLGVATTFAILTAAGSDPFYNILGIAGISLVETYASISRC